MEPISDTDKLQNVEMLSVLFPDIDAGTLAEAILQNNGHDFHKASQSLAAMGANEAKPLNLYRLFIRFVTCQTRNKQENCVQLSHCY
jgi:hypothetical protein